jgi:hypothetical protein
MDPTEGTPSARSPRREFLADVGLAGAALALGACTGSRAARGPAPAPARGDWDLSWLDRVRRSRHRALFDAPSGGIAPMLAARYLDNVATVYGLAAPSPEVAAVINLRTVAARLGLADALWQKYPIGEDGNLKDAAGTPVRRNPSFAPEPGASEDEAAMSLHRLQARGALLIVCDFALGHLAGRLATKVGATAPDVHAEFRRGLLPGAFLVPSGIFGMTEAQNAGCAFVPG